ncbi:MAG: hypothetical protein JWM06_1916, partial [Actinomycetia bacterium]|nr:hypothetical protein [Actinomycetes bacterium]
GNFSGSWSFSTTSNFSGSISLPYTYSGFHSFFQVRVNLSAFVTHLFVTTTYPLVSAGPVNCCEYPSGGFNYTGTTTLNVADGDTYGFTMSGSHFDGTYALQGSLTVGPHLATSATPSVGLGGTIADSATLADTGAGAHGTITFNAYSDSQCATSPVHTRVVAVGGDGTYVDPGFAPATLGTYYWTASYSGDPTANTLGAIDACGAANESSTVTGNAATISTTATGPVELGGTIADSATLSGTAPGAHGTITFKTYTDSACSTPAIHTQDVTVNGDGVYSDPGFVPTQPGTYYWTASYSGDPATSTVGANDACGAANESSTVTPPGNDSWSNALPISLDGNGNGGATGAIKLSGQARWYKVDVTPGGDLQVDLSNLPANYDLAVFSDIGQAFNRLTAPNDLQTVSAEFSGDAFSPSVFSPSVFSPSVFSPSVFSPSVFSPSVFSPSVFSPSVFSPSVFSPSVFSPSVFSPSVFSPDPTAYQGAQLRSLIGISANDGSASEHVFANIWNNTGSFYIRVNGRNGTYDPSTQFTLNVHENTGTCGGVAPSSDPLLSSGYNVPSSGLKTLVLADYGRMTAGSDLSTMESKVTAFSGQVGGTVVDVAQASPRVAALNAQADAHAGCPYAKNLVAGAIKDVVDAYRAQNPNLKYIVIVGDDHVIPFFRYPDTAGLGPESNYAPPVLDNTASQANLRSNDVLSQDAYGSTNVLHLKGADLPIPDLPVGRLVETPAEISGMLDAYMGLTNGVVPTPSSSLVTGYDFMAGGAQSVQGDLSAGLGGTSTNDHLITDQGVAPSDTGSPPRHSWTADQLRTALLGRRHDLIFLAGHFSANNTLAADYSTTMNSTELAASNVDLTNSIVFSAGCHSGYTIVNGDAVPNVTEPLDWTQAFAQKRATLIAGTGYQYGDTDFLEYSERLYADFAHALRLGTGAVAVGNALVQAKATYLTDTPNLKGIDVKSLLESTLYGLPMLSVDLPSGRIAAPSSSSIVGSTTPFAGDPGATLGLSYFDHVFSPTLITHTRQLVDQNGSAAGQPTATYLSGRDDVATSPGAPALPLEATDVSVGGGNVLRGVGFRGGTYTDQSGITPLTGAPGTELGGVHSPFISSAFFPSRPWTVNYFGGLTGGAGATRLMLMPAQYRSDAPGSLTDVQRTFSHVDLRLFYSANTGTYGANTPALAAPPTISRVDATATGTDVTFKLHVVGDPSAGIQEVWVTYNGVHANTWESLDLTQDGHDSTLWTGTLGGLTSAQVAALRFVVQAVNGVGLVGLDDNQGNYYRPDQISPALQTTSATRAATTLVLASPPAGGDYGSSLPVSAALTSAGAPVPGAQVSFTIGGSTSTAVTDASGVATAQLPLVALPGPYQLSVGFDGDTTLVGASASAAFEIRKLATTLTLNGDATVTDGASTGIQATLQSGAVGLPQRTIAFVLTPTGGGTAVIQTRITDLLGRASLDVVSQLPPGTYAVSAYFGSGAPIALPADAVYQSSTSGTSQLTVLRLSTITFPTIPAHVVDRNNFALPDHITATANSGLQVTVNSSTTSVCTVGNPTLAGGETTWTLTVKAVGTCTLTASQAGNAAYAAAQPVTQSFQVARLVVIGSQEMDNSDLTVAPGATLRVGYDFKIPGRHPAASVSVLRAKVVFGYTCTTGRNVGIFTVTVPDAVGILDGANSTAWYPSGDERDPSVNQGSLAVPDVCPSGSLVRLHVGLFSAGVISKGTDKMNVRWHYSAGGRSSGWSGTGNVVPS